MSKKILLIIALALLILLTGIFAWYFNPAPAEICLDGACHKITDF